MRNLISFFWFHGEIWPCPWQDLWGLIWEHLAPGKLPMARNELLHALEEKCLLKINNELIMKTHKAKLNKKLIWFLWMMSACVSFDEPLRQIIKVGHSDEVSLNDTSIFSWPLLIFTVCYPRMMWMLGNGSKALDIMVCSTRDLS